MIFAEMSAGQGGVIGAIVGGIPSALIALGVFLKGRRKDAMSEWQQTVIDLRRELSESNAAHDKQIAEMRREHYIETSRLEEQIRTLEARERVSYEKAVQTEADLRIAQANLRRLQAQSYDTAPGLTQPTEITADESGVIYWTSAGVGPMFHWLPQHLMKKNITVLIPERLREAHRLGLQKMVESGKDPDPERAVHTYAITKDGEEFPVTINLCAWNGQAGKRYINAEIRRRAPNPESGIIRPYGPTVKNATPADKSDK